jgi:hypothetical protein
VYQAALLDEELTDLEELGTELDHRLSDGEVDASDFFWLLVFARAFACKRRNLGAISRFWKVGLYFAVHGPNGPGKHLQAQEREDLAWLKERLQEESPCELTTHGGSYERRSG